MGRIRFVVSPLGVGDLLTILPFYLPMLLPIDLRFTRAFRLVRVFKMTRYSESLKTFGKVLHEKRHELALTIFLVLLLFVSVSSLMYFVENDDQPQVFSSIPAAMWSTLTTIGYGNVYPVTPVGKILGAGMALLGIGMFALPAGILGSGFVEEHLRKRDDKSAICPHCGKVIDGRSATDQAKDN